MWRKKMTLRTGIVFIYGLLLLIGGIIGYLKADSMVSLFMGSLSALLVWTSARLMAKGFALGTLAALALTSVLTLFFLYRFMQTHAFMPAGLMIGCGFVVIGTLLFAKKNPVGKKI